MSDVLGEQAGRTPRLGLATECPSCTWMPSSRDWFAVPRRLYRDPIQRKVDCYESNWPEASIERIVNALTILARGSGILR